VIDWVEQVRGAAEAALAPVEGELAVPGLRDSVVITRDRWGVPHISASNDDDLFLAQGFVAASERLFQIDSTLRLANGRLATMFADLVVPMDRFARIVGWNRAGARVAATYDERSQAMVSSFRRGAAAWLELMPAKPIEYQILGLDAELPEDDASWAASSVFVAWSLSGNWDEELLRSEITDRFGWQLVRTLFPDLPPLDPALVAGARPSSLDVLEASPRVPRAQGSNNWVVSGERSASGKPLLANDPHLLVATPSIWFEVHLTAPGIDVSGVSFPFAPGVVIGRTAHHAWGLTNVGCDTQDIFVEELDDDGTAARFDAGWEPLAVHREEIQVRGRDDAEVLEVRATRHGPLLEGYQLGRKQPRTVPFEDARAYALSWVGSEHAVLPSTLHAMATATSFETFRDALRGWESPGLNVVYADVDGTIGYQCTGLYPVRRRGDGTVPVPGWSSEYGWDGFVPFEELPWNVDPPEGFLLTANNRIHDGSYPHLIGLDFAPPFRARRIAERLAEVERHSAETFASIQTDVVSIPARETARYLSSVGPRNDEHATAIALLRDWDGELGAGSAAAALYESWCDALARRLLAPRLGERPYEHYYAHGASPFRFVGQVLPGLLSSTSGEWFGQGGDAARDGVVIEALDETLGELRERLGPDPSAWRWGALHKVSFASPLAMVADLAPLLTVGVVETGGDAHTIAQAAFEPGAGFSVDVLASWRMIVDLADPDAALGVHTTGQSGNPVSPHWSDQLPLWRNGRHHPMPFTPRAVAAAAAGVLTIRPR
jgi:penicillin G amidase